MNRGVLERVKSQETVHFTAETPSAELLFRIIHSANQFSMYGAVWSWSGQPSPNETEPILEKFVTSEESVNTVTLKSVSSQEISSLVDSARSRHVSGNRGRDDLQDIFFRRNILNCEDVWSGIILEPCRNREALQDSSRHEWRFMEASHQHAESINDFE